MTSTTPDTNEAVELVRELTSQIRALTDRRAELIEQRLEAIVDTRMSASELAEATGLSRVVCQDLMRNAAGVRRRKIRRRATPAGV